MITFNDEKEWVKFVLIGQLDEAYKIYLSHNPRFNFFKQFSFRRTCSLVSLLIVFFVKKSKVRCDSDDKAVDLSEEFLIFWKCPNIMGRLLLRKIAIHFFKTGNVPVRPLAWYGHWLVFQGRYGEALAILKYSLKTLDKGSRLHGEVLSLVGNYFYSRGNFDESIRFHEKSNATLQANGDKFFQMFNLGTSAKVYAELGDLDGFNSNILAGYDHLDPKEPDERYGMRVLIYGAYLNFLAGNNDLGRQFYISAEKSFNKSGSSLDKSVFCIYKSVILLFFRDLGGARDAIDAARKNLKRYGGYRTYENLIINIKNYLATGTSSSRITDNLLSKDGATVRSELESWYFSYFSMILPILENFQSREIDRIIKSLEQATSSFASISFVKEDVSIEDVKEVCFLVDETPDKSTGFKADLFHNGKMYELCLLTNFKQWRNPEIIETIRSTLVLLQNISKQDQLRSITFLQSQKLKEGEIARRIAHDIRSPLAALQMAVSSMKADIDNFSIIKSSTQRIEDIANSLTRKRDGDIVGRREKILLKPFIDSLVATKRFEFRGQETAIEVVYARQAGAQYIDVNELELSRSMSNIINNSAESYGKGGPIKITVDLSGSRLMITVKDQGCGIDSNDIARVFERDFSKNKKGSGLGLFYAKQFIEANGGTIEIESELGAGTSVVLTYPVSCTPEWIKTTLFLADYKKVIVVDDFVANIEIMKEKIKKHCPEKEIVTFFELSSFKKHMAEVDDSNDTFFVIDYDFVNCSQTGIDVLLANKLNDHSVLATHHYEDENLIRSCKDNRIKIVPKIIFNDIRIINDRPDIFIVDDEKYFLKAIQGRLGKKFNLHLYENEDGLMEKVRETSTPAFFFIDRNFKNSAIDGATIMSSLADLGINDLYNISEDVSFIHPSAIKIRKNELEHFLT